MARGSYWETFAMTCRRVFVVIGSVLGSVFFAVLIGVVGAEANDGRPASGYTPLTVIRNVRVCDHSAAFPGGHHEAVNLLDGNVGTEYSSNGAGVGTFVEFDFGQPTALSGMRHVDRNDPATVAQAEIAFSNQADFGSIIAKFTIDQTATSGGTTNFFFAKPVTARYARWRVTALGPKGYGTVGGAEMLFFQATDREEVPTKDALKAAALPVVLRDNGKELQSLAVTVQHPYVEPAEATLEAVGGAPLTVHLNSGEQTFELGVPPVAEKAHLEIALRIAGQTMARAQVELKPVRHWEFVVLPHSHVDIGYTHVQTEVERKQWSHIEQAIALARQTADMPPEARFKWNVEVLWAVDSYLKQASPQQRQSLIEAVRRGWIGLDGLYGNELTALCRPEELFHLLDCARRISRDYNVPIEAAMISDVPGYTWGIVPALAQNGIKYFSIGPNHIHRIGRTLSEWGDRPFYWVSPSGQEKVLCWIAGHGYSWFHNGLLGKLEGANRSKLMEYLEQLEAAGYPYELVQLRYSIGGDNGPPDPALPQFVADWNARYQWPKMRIATTAELFRQFEQRYGKQIPEVRGDFTPYWEDGAGSSARETALARNAAERLVQAETLWTLFRRGEYPDGKFYDAWRNVILYNEHTWGAHCSISQPDSQFTKDQWAIKQAFALDAAKQSRCLLEEATGGRRATGSPVEAIDVFNTASWPQTDLVLLPADMTVVGDVVRTADGQAVASQRLHDGALALLAENVPPLGSKRFVLSAGKAAPSGSAKAEDGAIGNSELRVVVDKVSGAITSFTANGIPSDLANSKNGLGLNTYSYVAGRKPEHPEPNGPVTVTAEDAGPLVATLRIESPAPGCRQLVRRLQVTDRIDRVDVTNTVDKEDIRDKESVHFGFALNVPEGTMRLDTPWAVVRPEVDQLCGACKNYLTVGRWVDVSSAEFGVTWATLDAPLIEIGRISVDVASPFDPGAWIEHLEPAQTWYSYVMNNYWETNYRASQDGPTTFRYALQPHRRFDQAAAARFGIERSQPMVVVPVKRDTPQAGPRLRVEPAGVILTSLRPSDDGKALIVRLFNAGDTPQKATLEWAEPAPIRVSHSSPRQEVGPTVAGTVDLPAMGIVTLRAELDR